jgi:hypothetical protein
MGMRMLAGDVMGDDELDDSELDGMELVGRAARRMITHHAPARPNWRRRLAPGVMPPGYGVVPLSLEPQTNDGVFDATHQVIKFIGETNQPFRGERYVSEVDFSTGATGIQLRQSPIFVGTIPQQADLNELPVKSFQATAFGVRFVMIQVEPGVKVTVTLRAVTAVPADEAITVSIFIMGRYVH